jgi:hypothetical protein
MSSSSSSSNPNQSNKPTTTQHTNDNQTNNPIMEDPDALPPRPKMLPDLDYTEELLQQRLKYAEKVLARGDMSPRSTYTMSEYKSRVEDALKASTTTQDHLIRVAQVRVLDRVIENFGFP